jgi:hypothetical protein
LVQTQRRQLRCFVTVIDPVLADEVEQMEPGALAGRRQRGVGRYRVPIWHDDLGALVEAPERPISNDFLPLGEGLQALYVEAAAEWLHWRTLSPRFELFKRPT